MYFNIAIYIPGRRKYCNILFFPQYRAALLSLPINLVIVKLYKCQILVETAHHHFPEPKVTLSNSLLCRTSSPKAKSIQLAMICKREKLHILTFKRLEERANVQHFNLINDFNSYSISKIADSFSASRLI